MDVLIFGVLLGGGLLVVTLLPLAVAILSDPAHEERRKP
jgi:hypothetical protein